MLAIATPVVLGEVTDKEVGNAIEAMKKYLYYKQDPQTGSWEFRSRSGGVPSDALQVGGETALVTQALLVSGESAQNPKMAKALQYLRSVEMKGTYAVGIRSHVWSHLPPEYLPMLEMDASWLLEAASRHQLGLFDYEPKSSDRVDHSVTQYGILGLWEASKRGLKIPRKHWKRWAEHFVTAQREDGGWSYSSNPDGITTGSMTAAGLTALFVCQQELYRSRSTPEPKVTAAIQKGVAWLDKRFVGHNNPNGNEWTYYYLYGIERVALSSGLRYFNNRDWYQAGATHIIDKLGSGDNIDDDFASTAFSLMFLSRGRVPVWINKLQIPGGNWNNFPSDIYTLTHYLSDQIEKEVNWQVISIDLPAENWLVAPIAYLASSQPLSLNEKQKATLKRYLDLGGLLIANPDGKGPGFSDSIRALAAEIYPQYEITQLADDHPMYNCWHRLSGTENKPKIHTLSNGARELIILLDSGWGRIFQLDQQEENTPVWDMATNIFAYATDRGALTNRLVQPFERREGRGFRGQITIGRASYDGNWLPEPEAWEQQSNYVFNQSGLDVKVTDAVGSRVLNLDQIGRSDLKLIHLTGTHAINLTTAQKKAIQKYLNRGGTILIETVSGQGEFSRSLGKQLSSLFESHAVPLTPSDPIISGEGLEGGQDNRRTLYRRYTVVKFQYDPKPNLAAFLDKNGRPMVILSHEDLSLGMLGCRHWNIVGYQPETSRKIVNNIVLWANQQELDR